MDPSSSSAAADGLAAWEPKLKRPKVEILDGSQVSSFDFFNIGRPVSTGLALSLQNPNLTTLASSSSASGDSSSAFRLLPASALDDAFHRELQRMDAEIDSFIRLQGDRLRKSILDKVQEKQFLTLASFEEKFRHKIKQKELQIQDVTKRNMELEEQLRKLSYEVGMWQQQAKDNEDMIAALQLKFQQVYAQNQINKREGCGDSSEVECPKGGMDFQLLCKGGGEEKEHIMACKACGVNEMCMLLFPCRHLCLCKDCEVKLNFCPICRSSKLFGAEVYA